ncbi:MAG: decarboxylating 6-phosphogluconate dehydrogenase [Actinobacteria bacterium]|nr:decarboxylating 6-phosphogluconate dehydrogenase [Chloroflexota bacterium]MCL5291969.1 decarboxylating 6-phosphogluconate dehydrogenase [Actinomycetota bacterium]
MEFGVVGLGKMGGGLATQAVEKGFRVVGVDTKERPELASHGIGVGKDVSYLTERLKAPRAIFLYIPAGPGVDAMVEELLDHLDNGDVIVDGGNSHYGDSIRRHRRCKEAGIHFVDCGTSGGLSGARNGACFMVGGDEEPVKMVEPILEALAVPEGYIHAGPSGAGHFVKLVHNAIEFGMLQSIGEGIALLEKSPYELDLAALFHNWANGSVIRGWLVELMETQLIERSIDEVSAYVEDTGEVNWIVEEALKMEVAIPAVSTAVMQLFSSRDDRNVAWRAIAMMRHGFGGHPFGSSEATSRERQVGEVNPSDRRPRKRALRRSIYFALMPLSFLD